MRRTLIVGIVVLGAAAIGGWYWYAQSNAGAKPSRAYRIGILVRGSGYDPAVKGFQKRMDELGYHEGQNITYDVQTISDKTKLAATVDTFIDEHIDLIHTYSTPATEAAYTEIKKRGKTIPIVFGSVGDPLLVSGVRSIDHPGANVTGVASLSTDLTSKRLQLLKEYDPRIRRVAMPHTALEEGDLAANKSVAIATSTAAQLGIELTLFPVRTKEDNALAAQKITADKYDGMIVGGDSLVWGSLSEYVKQSISQKIPFSVFSQSQVESGALFGLGPNFAVSGKQSADLANKILRGGDPASIPVQIPQLIFVINQETAQKIGAHFTDTFFHKADLIVGKPAQ